MNPYLEDESMLVRTKILIEVLAFFIKKRCPIHLSAYHKVALWSLESIRSSVLLYFDGRLGIQCWLQPDLLQEINKVTKVTCKSIMATVAVLLMNPLGISNERERGCLVSTHTIDNYTLLSIELLPFWFDHFVSIPMEHKYLHGFAYPQIWAHSLFFR